MLRRLSSKSQSPGHIFKSFTDFLNSSIWDIPIATFIEERSTVFDREHGKLEDFKEIHKEYSELVDTLIECFCDDYGIKPEQLTEALQAIERDKMNAKQKAFLEPVIAAQDIKVFVQMMSRKNVELQLQALQMIEFMCGLLPNLVEEDWEALGKKMDVSPQQMDRVILIAVMKRSKEEYDEQNRKELELDLEAIRKYGEEERKRLQALLDEERNRQKQMESGQMAGSSKLESYTQTEKPATANGERRRSVSRPRSESGERKEKNTSSGQEPEMKTTDSNAQTKKDRPLTAKKKPPAAPPMRKQSASSKTDKEREKQRKEEKEKEKEREKEKDRKELADVVKYEPHIKEEAEGRHRTREDILALLQPPNRVATADVRARAEYLRAQRDKLLEMKRSEREKQLLKSEEAGGRPKTAQAARGALRGDRRTHDVDDEVLKARKALAEKLKLEVDN